MASPMYSPHLQFNPTFRWGGQEWGVNDRARFIELLRRRGGNYNRWAQRHQPAARVFDPVEQQIYSMFQPQITGIEAERQRTADLWNRRMQNLTGFSAALMPFLQQVPGNILHPYREGAAGVESAGAGYGGSLNADTSAQAAEIDAILGGINSPQSAEGGTPGDIIAGLGGMEGDLMRAAGAAHAGAAEQLPKTASLEATLMMKDLLAGAAEEDKSFSNEILQVLQGLPGARAGMRQQASEEKLRQQKFALDRLESERKWYLQQAALASARGDDRRAEHYLKLAQDRERRMQLGTQGLDAMGNPKPGYHLNPKTGLVVPDKGTKKGSQSSTVPGTPAWRAAQVKAVGQAQPKIEKDVAAYMEAAGIIISPMDPQAPRTTQLLNQLKRDLWEKYNYLATTPTAKKRLRKAIELAVRRWKPKKGTGTGSTGGAGLLELEE